MKTAHPDNSTILKLAADIEVRAGEAVQQYHRLVLVVGPTGTGKTAVLKAVGSKTGWPIVNLNLRVSEQLLDIPQRRRPTALPRILSDILDSASEIVLVDNVELLFSPEFEQNPLALLQGLARNRTLVIAWPGCVSRGKLQYATPGHPEAKQYPLEGLTIVQTAPSQSETVDVT